MYFETKTRSIFKGFSWRFLATTTTIIIVYIFFGRLDLAVAAGFFETIAKVLLYYFHERIWQKIRFGKKEVSPIIIYIDTTNYLLSSKIIEKLHYEFNRNQIPINTLNAKDFNTFQTYQHLEHLIEKLYHSNISLCIQNKYLSRNLFDFFCLKPLNIVDIQISELKENSFQVTMNDEIVNLKDDVDYNHVASTIIDNISRYMKKINS